MRLVTIKLLGELGRRFGREYRLAISSPAEAIRALMTQLDGFREYIRDSHEHGILWRVVTEDPMGLDEEGMRWPCGERVVIAPQPAGREGIGKIFIGIALILVGALVAFPTAGGGIPLITAGIGFLFSGIASLITPTPPKPTEQKNSFTFDRSNLNTQQGSPVPVLYGERIIGAMPVLSFGITLQNSL